MAQRPAKKTANVGRPKKVSRSQIVEAALQVMEEDGFAALSLRALARRLGINHATLYNYIDNISEIEQDALNALMARIPMPDRQRPEPIRQQLIEHLLGVRRTQIVFPKFCYAPAGSLAWRLHMASVANVIEQCSETEDQVEDVAVAYNALIALMATQAERVRALQGGSPIQTDLEAMAALPKEEFAALFRPLQHKGGYAKHVTSFVHRLDYLIGRLIPHLPELDDLRRESLAQRFAAEDEQK